MARNYSKARRRTLEQAVYEKLNVLKEFCIVNRMNEEEYRKILLDAAKSEPDRNYDVVLDQVARDLIKKKIEE